MDRGRRFLYLIPFALVALGFWLKRPSPRENPALVDEGNARLGPPPGPGNGTSAGRALAPPMPPPTAMPQLELLRGILNAGNDNDPRLDLEFRQLTPALKQALRGEYTRWPAEKRNARGTIVFLLGREISAPGDLRFFEEVLNEEPCGSLGDCARSAANQVARDRDAEPNAAIEVTLAYPQLVALKALERLQSDRHAPPALREGARAVIRGARGSRVKIIAEAAQRIVH